ncbi:MAG: hypothetical protein ACC700_21140, partial [Anaerolineales bacterium]
MKTARWFPVMLVGTLFLAACAQAAGAVAVPSETRAPEPTEVQEPTEVEEALEEPEDEPGFQVEAFIPGARLGGTRIVEVESAGDDVRWILPGPRALDPNVFGTPDRPLGLEPEIGLPLEARLVSDDGSAYTTTAGPTPFSDNFALIGGSVELKAVDATLVDGPDSKDKVDLTASFTGPDGKEYTLTLLKVIPKGPNHPFFGGVAANIIQHGATGIGTKLFPGAYTYLAFWGVAELSVDGEVVASNRLLHGMVTSNARDEDYKLGFDEDVDNSKAVLHLILPNTELTPDGPQTSPVPTGFELPNGVEQPFMHIMFEDIA